MQGKVLPRGAVCALLVIVIASVSSAQLSGTYTIDPNGSGPTNFTTIGAALSTLQASGVSAPVLFKMAATTFNEALSFPPVSGVSSTITVTFQGAGAATVIDAGAAANAFHMQPGCQWYVFDGFGIQNFTTYGLFLDYLSPARCENIVFQNVRIDGPTTGTSSRTTYFNQARYLTFTNCVFTGGYYTLYSQGMYYSVFDTCEFDGKGFSSRVMAPYNANAASCAIINCFAHDPSASGYTVNLALSHHGTMVWHNVFIGKTSSPVVYLGGCCAWTRANSFRNNIVVQHGTGPAMQYASTATNLQYNDLDYNCYYAPNATAGAIKLSTAQTGFSQGSLAQWNTYLAANPTIIFANGGTQYDQNSMEADPMLVSATAPYDLHIQGTSPCLDAGTQQYVPGAWLAYPPTAAPNLPTTVLVDFEGDPRGTLPDIGVDELAVSLIGSGSGQPGTTITFTLNAPPDAGLVFQVGSSFGNGPIPIDTRKLELSPDPMLFLSISNLAATIFQDYAGVLDAKGGGTAKLNIPKIPGLSTIRIYTAFVTLKASAPSGISNISNTFLFTIQ